MPSETDLARKILELFRRDGAKNSGHAIMAGAFSVIAKHVGLNVQDVPAALMGAKTLGWVEEGDTPVVRITAQGLEAMHAHRT